jgi:tetratricopeptide (TPR) repeat protein
MMGLLFFTLLAASAVAEPALEAARDRQDRSALQSIISGYEAAASKTPGDAAAQYKLALASSYLAEVATEVKDKAQARTAAETGIKAAERAVALNGGTAEHHRILGTLCGQLIPANVFAGLKYGRCAMDEIKKAIELDPKSSLAYVSKGVGNYYLPPTFGGGVEPAIQDFQKAIELDPKLAEAHMWLGLALRKANRNKEAREALARSLQLNPNRVWIKQQLDKTPAQ